MTLWFRRFGIACLALMLFLSTHANSAEASGVYDPFPYGQCTYWVALMRPDLVRVVWGNAFDWPNEAARNGYFIGARPRVGAVAVLQPGVQETWSLGHVAYVVAVSGAWFEVSQMDWPWPAVVSYHWFHTGWGVSFIY